jgi:hypothetical protein
MKLFGRREITSIELKDEVAACRAEVSRLASVVRQLEGEMALQHEQVRKWMRRAVAAENRAVERDEAPPAPPALVPPAQQTLWGPRARRLARMSRPDPAEEMVNGLHS